MITTENTERIQVVFTLDVNVQGWREEYGMDEGQVAVDAASYFRNVLHELRVVREGLATIREDDPEPRGAEDALLVPAERLQSFWGELRELHAVCVRTPAPREVTDSLAWMCMGYSKLVGIELKDVQLALQYGSGKAPTRPLGATASALSASPPESQ